MSNYKPITLSPAKGGRLAADISANELGLANYRVKRDWRRYKDRERRREGYAYFRPNLDVAQGDQALNAGAIINLVYGAKAESGRRATIAGTAATIYRYFWTGKYVSDVDPFFYFTQTGVGTPYIAITGADTPYVLDNPDASPYFSPAYVKDDYSGWTVIGRGFSPTGYRWEALNVGDDVVMNNGVDLPVVHGLNEFETSPLYELREQGVAAVGTITEFNGILKCADILQIKESKLEEVFSPVALSGTAAQTGAQSSGTSHATQAIASYTVDIVSGAFVFDAGMVGKTLRFRNGFSGTIVTYNNPSQVVLDKAPAYVGETYGLEMASGGAAQTIAVRKGKLYLFTATRGTLINSGTTLRSGVYFTAAADTVTIQGTGLSVKRVFYPASGNNDMRFYILNADDSDITVIASEPVFDSSMTGLNLYWDSGEVRRIQAFVSSTEVVVESDFPITSGRFAIENRMAYGPITDPEFVDRRVYRTLWSSVGQARRFAAQVPCSIAAGSRTVVLDYPVKSLQAGQEVIITGAGINGGNLITTIAFITAGQNKLILMERASTTVTEALVQQSDMVGSIVGFEDLEEDGSRIIRMLDLNGQLVIYRDGGYQLAVYDPSFDSNGTVITAFKYSKLVKTVNTLFYKHSLITVSQSGTNFHVFAGRNAFYRFDMISRLPVLWEPAEMNNQLFFDAVNAATTFTPSLTPAIDDVLRVSDFVFAVEHALTKEIFMVFPGHATEKALCYDYEQGTMSTTSMVMSAAATIVKPSADDSGNDEHWFVMATYDGKLLLYGLTDQVNPAWGSKAIYNRLGSNYDSEIYSGLGHFNVPTLEKHINGYTFEMSSFTDDFTMKVELYGAKNPNSKAAVNKERLLGTRTFSAPSTVNFFPVHYLANYLADRIIVSGKDNPVELSARTFRVGVLDSAGQARLS